DEVAILSDIQGIEDFLGDMDFKVCGTEKGITALQMDNKAKGLNIDILAAALAQAKEGRAFILGKITEAISEPRADLSPHAPRIISIQIPVDRIRDIIGTGGKVIRGLQEETGATIEVAEDGTVYIASKDTGGIEAQRRIEQIIKVPEIGEEYLGRVVSIQSFGAFIEILPGKDGLLHISRVANGRIGKVEDVLSIGDELKVKIIDIDDNSKVSLDRLDKPDAPEGYTPPARDDRGPRRDDRGGRGGGGGRRDFGGRSGSDHRSEDERRPRRRH
ncbi:MAG: S1 RNA-binding domain-containing protein, partial [Coriobacteriales bacterium]|nr:S1 RNA-binding domain-containing protein [Coriobacteriales bacterium]